MAEKIGISLSIQFDEAIAAKNLQKTLAKLEKQAKNLNINLGSANFKVTSDKITKGFQETNKVIKETTKSTELFGGSLFEAGKKFTQWYLLGGAITTAINSIKQGVTSVVDLDDAMVELRKTSNATTLEYKLFTEQAFEASVALGKVGSEVVNATSSFSRMGFELNKALSLGKDAILMSNVADDMNLTQSTNTLISTLKGFNLEASQSISIIDKFNNVSNNFALTMGDISNVVSRASATLKTSGNTLDQTIALAVGAQEVLQDSAKVG